MKIGSRDFGRAGHHHHSHHTISPLSVDIHWFTTFRLTLSLSTVAALAEYSASALAIHCALKFRYPWHHTDTAHAIYLKHHLAEVEWIDLSEHLYDIYKNPFFFSDYGGFNWNLFPFVSMGKVQLHLSSFRSVAHLARLKNPLDHTEGWDQLCDKQQNGYFKLS